MNIGRATEYGNTALTAIHRRRLVKKLWGSGRLEGVSLQWGWGLGPWKFFFNFVLRNVELSCSSGLWSSNCNHDV